MKFLEFIVYFSGLLFLLGLFAIRLILTGGIK